MPGIRHASTPPREGAAEKNGGMEFYDVHFSYIDKETLEEHFVSVKGQGGGGLIPEGQSKPGVVHTIGLSDKDMPGVYRIEMQVTAGSGKLAMSGLWSSTATKVSQISV
ncbi:MULTISPECIES: hypothetical protein [Halomonadaceae]|uniref:hypothetical protein n=1 Tax=Halomonadaceae TaxID=28256 RepID=UPI001EF0B1C1|nr:MULTISPECIES: hypothetical protein [Halomonas]